MQGVGLDEVFLLQFCASAQDAEAVRHLGVLHEGGGGEDGQPVGKGALHPRERAIAQVDGERVGSETRLRVWDALGGELPLAKQPRGVAAEDVEPGGVGPVRVAHGAQLR